MNTGLKRTQPLSDEHSSIGAERRVPDDFNINSSALPGYYCLCVAPGFVRMQNWFLLLPVSDPLVRDLQNSHKEYQKKTLKSFGI